VKRLALLVVLLMTTGCASALDNAIHAANGAGQVTDHAHVTLSADTKRGYDLCLIMSTKTLALECVEQNRAQFAPAWSAYRALRHTWLSLAAMIQAAQAADGALPGGATVLLGKLAQAVSELQFALVEVQR